MALFFRDDASYDESVRMTGFYRYRQLLSFYTFGWVKVNLLTVLGSIPLAAGIIVSILSSSLLLLIPLSVIGGMIFGPFLASMVDAILRGMRDTPGQWWRSYKKSFRQNLTDSLLPGAFTGFTAGIFAFMIHMMWHANSLPGSMPLLLAAFSALLVLILHTLYWPQLVLFRQSIRTRLINTILFTSKYLWRVLLAAVLQALWITILILFAPWTLVLIPFFGFWLPIFFAQFTIYKYLDEELQIEKRIAEALGYPEDENTSDENTSIDEEREEGRS